MLSKDVILSAKDIKRTKVNVPEWGGEIFISEITAAERDNYESSINNGKVVNLANVRARLLVKCITDADGNRLFTDTDAPALGAKNSKVISRLWDIANTINGIGNIEEQTKN